MAFCPLLPTCAAMPSSRLHLNLLERIPGRIILPQHNLPLPLRARVLHPNLLGPLTIELADEPRIPEFRRNAQVLAAAHQRVRFAALGRGGNTVWIKVLLLAARDGHESGYDVKHWIDCSGESCRLTGPVQSCHTPSSQSCSLQCSRHAARDPSLLVQTPCLRSACT